MEKIDLHIHTNYSDGELNIPQLITKLNDNSIKKISIADHDTIINLEKYISLFEENNIKIISGIEFNTDMSKLHILGYGIQDLEKVENIMLDLKLKNQEICKKVIKLLQCAGINITENGIYRMLLEEAKERILLSGLESKCTEKIDIIIDKKAIVKWLLKEGQVSSVFEAYNTLIGRNAPYYIGIDKINKYDVIKLILDTGGIPVIAHPMSVKFKTKEEYYDFIYDLKMNGLEGIEIYGAGPKLNNYWCQSFEDIANKLNLIKTAGSDFHNLDDEIGVYCDESIWGNFSDLINDKQPSKTLKKK